VYSFVGIGGSGSRVIAQFYKRDPLSYLFTRLSKETDEIRGVAIDTSETLAGLNAIPAKNRVLLGYHRVKGHGTGGDAELGRKILEEERTLAMNAIRGANPTKPDAFILIASAAGGTGAGGLPSLAQKLKRSYRVPVFGVLLLPAALEGRLFLKNASANLPPTMEALDGVILLDNNVPVMGGGDIQTSWKEINETICRFFRIVEPKELLTSALGKVSTIGALRTKTQRRSIQSLLKQILRERIYFPLEGAIEGMYLYIHGNPTYLVARDVAKEWVKNEYQTDLGCVYKEHLSKYLNIALLITGLKATEYKEEVEDAEEEPSELEKLLGDISPL
jgi:cell division GTPase FtsZ